MAVIGIATAFDNDIGVRLEQANQLLAGRHGLPRQHPPLALRDNPLDQRLIITEFGLPKWSSCAAAVASCASASEGLRLRG